jgi:Phytanoyl-CoA dioxygenase (PhyH)
VAPGKQGTGTLARMVGSMPRLRRQQDGPAQEQVSGPYTSAPELFAEIERAAAANRVQRSLDTERRLVRMRYLAAIRCIEESTGKPEYATPAFDRLPESQLAEVPATQLTPGVLRAGILRDGCLLVRGLIERAVALRFAERIDRAFTERDRCESGRPFADAYFEEFSPAPAYAETLAYGRPWIRACCGLSASDSPLLSFEMVEMYRAAGLPRLIDTYVGETALISVEKTTLRKAEPSVPGAWHQDGSFMGSSRAVNMWLALSRCGDEAPGLDIVPRRLDHFVRTRTEEALIEAQISQRAAEEAAGEVPILRPVFDPGDALFFDGMLLHQTGSDPSMPRPRFGIENWFFGASTFPDNFTPIAI